MKLKIVAQELFYVLSGAIAVFFVMETVWPRIILAYINVSLVLIIWFIVATIILAIPEKK